MDLIDHDHAAELRALLGPRFAAMAETFVTQATAACGELAAAVAVGDLDATSRAAHRLRGSAGALGARALADAAGAIEQAARAGTVDGLSDRVAALAALLHPTAAALVSS